MVPVSGTAAAVLVFVVLIYSVTFLWNSVMNQYETEQFIDYLKTTVNHMSEEDRAKFLEKNKDSFNGIDASERITEDDWVTFLNKNRESFEEMESSEKKKYLKVLYICSLNQHYIIQ